MEGILTVSELTGQEARATAKGLWAANANGEQERFENDFEAFHRFHWANAALAKADYPPMALPDLPE